VGEINMSVTPEKLAAIDFTGVESWRQASREKREASVRERIKQLDSTGSIAVELLAYDKAELMRLVAVTDSAPKWLMEFTKAAESAKAMLDLMRAVQARLSVALAAVEVGRTPPKRSR
jgi:acetyl-CoA carboxylase carboxyltransferase component